MIESISINNTGLFKQAKIDNLKKINIIYAQNGKGKSTLAEIFESASEKSPELIKSRKTIDSQDNPLIKIIESTGEYKFANSDWRNGRPLKAVTFNSNFIEKNIHTGHEISPDNRKNLLTFALGRESVAAKIKLEKIDSYIKKLKEMQSSNSTEFTRLYCNPNNIGSDEFISIEPQDISLIEAKILDIEEKMRFAENIELIKRRSVIETSLFDTIYEAINSLQVSSLMTRSLEGFHLLATHKIKQHRDFFGVEDSWIKEGLDHINDNSCPFCSQSLNDNQMFSVYQDYFNKELIDYQKALANEIKKFNSGGVFPDYLKKLLDWKLKSDEICKQWPESDVGLISIPNSGPLHDSLEQIIKPTMRVLKQKQVDQNYCPNEFIKIFESKLIDIKEIINQINDSCYSLNTKLEKFKEDQSGLSLIQLTSEKRNLTLTKIRSNPEVERYISRKYQLANRVKSANKRQREIRAEYKSEVEFMLNNYAEYINNELRDLYADFQLSNFNVNFRGSERTEFNLLIRNHELLTSGVNNSFRTSLSEGDKRTLSFALFISALKLDSEISDKVVIFDDPFTSLDSTRRNKTISKIVEIANITKQVFVLTHDEFFAKEIFQKTEQNSQVYQIKPACGGYSNFFDLDILKLCQSDYYKNYDSVTGYLENQSNFINREQEVAKNIRVLLEGYLHRKFPNKLPIGSTLGVSISKINDDNDFFAHYNTHIISEMREINEYSSQYHHDTNPNALNEPIQDNELRDYCEKVLKIIHS